MLWLAPIAIFALFTHVRVYANEAEIDYYENLIKSGIQSSTTYQLPTDARQYLPKKSKAQAIGYGSYDFVIVGAGSAGCVVASRLSEISNWTILLLEAGKYEDNFTAMPAMTTYSAHSHYNWGYNTTPQENCCAGTKGVCSYINGKSVGGSSTVNALLYNRGKSADYDTWASYGNPGWSYDEVLPYFKKSEDFRMKGGDPGYHGHGGYWKVEAPKPLSPKVDTYLDGAKELGIPIIDYNGRTQHGSGIYQANTDNGRRDSAARAFITPALNRKNLKILTESYVTNIVISNAKRAYRVIFSHKSVLYSVRANKEVILSASSISSPQILMLSGVGPREYLSKFNIYTKMDLQGVGKNLHNHVSFPGIKILTSVADIYPNLRDSISQFLYSGVGPLTTSFNSETIGFVIRENSSSYLSEVKHLFVPSLASAVADPNLVYGSVTDYTDPWNEVSMTSPNISNRVILMTYLLIYPSSRGQILLKSKDPYDYAILDSKCLADSADFENMLEGIQFALKLTSTEAFKKINARVLTYKPCSNFEVNSRDYWTCFIKHRAANNDQACGTCSMGPDPKRGAVVDHQFRVHGIKSLRVVDVSAIPISLSGDMSGVATMMGEKASDFIKRDYGVL